MRHAASSEAAAEIPSESARLVSSERTREIRMVSPSMVAQPVISALIAIPLTGENLSLPQWLGALAVVTGIFLVNISRREDVK